MSAPGVIFADNIVQADAVRDDLGLTEWITISPRTFERLRARIYEKRIIIAPGANPYPYRAELADYLGETPALYWLTGGAL